MENKYDCVLILKGSPEKGRCRDVDRAELKDYYIGYFLKLGKPVIKCTVRKTQNYAPTASDRYHIRNMDKFPRHVENILEYLHRYIDAKKAGEGPPVISHTPMEFSLHDLRVKTTLEDFLENAEINRVFCKIETGGTDG